MIFHYVILIIITKLINKLDILTKVHVLIMHFKFYSEDRLYKNIGKLFYIIHEKVFHFWIKMICSILIKPYMFNISWTCLQELFLFGRETTNDTFCFLYDGFYIHCIYHYFKISWRWKSRTVDCIPNSIKSIYILYDKTIYKNTSSDSSS